MCVSTVCLLVAYVRIVMNLQNSQTFLAKFLPASLLGVSAATTAENSGVLIGND
jgi:hypothetical protein